LQTKDYYKILGLPPSATLKEIKSAYRSLAHQYHPDKNNNDMYAAAKFETIKEAYEVLSNPSKKEYYLQQRWYDQVMNKKQTTTVVTPESILKQFIELDKYVSKLDVHRMDKEGLYQYISELLSGDAIVLLNKFGDHDINRSIVDTTLKSLSYVPYKIAQPMLAKLKKIKVDVSAEADFAAYTRNAKMAHSWNKFRLGAIICIVIVLCALIYLVSRMKTPA
jgi:curved DNA-binding protein CbpA